ncbi:MAG: MBL fold metallo-hydrolase [Synergistetes bacterium]|nr:MBL fold metallo-hydrolase [Synergistota bacterium]
MKITFLGAAREVTGSMYMLERNDGGIFLVDCGMFQGRSEHSNEENFPFEAKEVDFLILTHAHLDHSGRIPKLVKDGFSGKLYMTYPTSELVKVLWKDTVKLMGEEAEWKNRKNRRSGKPEVVPLFDMDDVERAASLIEVVPYDEMVELNGVNFRLRDAGHILGSSSVELWVDGLKMVFSGDVGPQRNGIEGAPAFITDADYVVVESTYGDRLHKGLDETRREFRDAILSTIKRGKVLIPSFVVDRAQRIIYEFSLMKSEGLLPHNLQIFFDSPMGKAVTEIYKEHKDLLSGEVLEFMSKGHDPFDVKGLSYVSSVEESKRINDVESAIVIAGSGMCNGGRIVHHLKHNLWKDTTSVIFVGYQAVGTLGRKIVEGAERVRVAGEDVKVAAHIYTINGFSAHADRDELLKWVSGFGNDTVFFVTHGEEKSSLSLAKAIMDAGKSAVVPVPGQTVELDRKEDIEKSVELLEGRGQILDDIQSKLDYIKKHGIAYSADVEALLKSVDVLLDAVRERLM